jgi:pimeloyl-ACP methyl ester carboxylesterase
MPETFRVDTASASLVGERSGEGRPALFLHAGVADRRMWRPQITRFENEHLTVAYDRRGFGETQASDAAFSHTEDLREVLDRNGIETATLIGCSQGGRIAIDLALAHPGRVDALVLIAPAVSGAPAGVFPPDIEVRMRALEDAEEARDLARVNEIEAGLWLDGPTSPAGRVGGDARALFLEMNGIALAHPELEAEIEPPSAYDRLAELAQPALVIWGALDFPHIKERCRHLVDALPHARGREVPDAAHLLNLERPEATNELLAGILP